MSTQAIITLAITLITTIILAGGWLRPDLVALLTLVVLGFSHLVSPQQALAGFSGSAVLTILAISIIAEGLYQTGISNKLGQFMKKMAGENENRLIMVIMLSGAALSLFMNNIAALSVLLPASMSLSRQNHIPPSRLLMPLAFGVIAGGMATLFTTSNIIASSALRDAGFSPFGLLEFLPIGIPIIIVTVLYIIFIGKKILPKRNPAGQSEQFHLQREELMDIYQLNSSLWEVVVLQGSGMAGLTIRSGEWRTKIRVNVIGITRNSDFISSPSSDVLIQEGDVLLTQGEPDLDALEYYGLKLLEEKPVTREVINSESTLAEIALSPHSKLTGKTLREIHFREKYDITVLAIWRAGKPVHIGFAGLPLRGGDGLLVRGTAQNLKMLNQEHDFIFLEEDLDAAIHPQKARLAGLIGLVTLFIGIAGWYPIALVSLGGAAAMVLAGCLSMDEAYLSINWKSIFLIAGIWPLSTAIASTGLSDQFVQSLLSISHNASPIILVSTILLITFLLTNIMSGQAAAPIILAPVGVAIAKSAGLDTRMVMMSIALGCSLAFATPIGHPVNIIVMGSGGYSYKDFLRVGLPLTVCLFIVILLGLIIFWGL
ncbi:MAG: SLC13 family permease [Chloroflexota bacterium]